MRLLLALALFLPLSGCLAADSGAADESPATEDVSDPVPRKGVVFFQAPYQAVPGQDAEFQVDVPAGAQNVVFEISQDVLGTPGMDAEVALAQCGADTASWGSGANIQIVIPPPPMDNWRGGTLCSLAGAGMQALTIEASLAPLAGAVLLRADLPAN